MLQAFEALLGVAPRAGAPAADGVSSTMRPAPPPIQPPSSNPHRRHAERLGEALGRHVSHVDTTLRGVGERIHELWAYVCASGASRREGRLRAHPPADDRGPGRRPVRAAAPPRLHRPGPHGSVPLRRVGVLERPHRARDAARRGRADRALRDRPPRGDRLGRARARPASYRAPFFPARSCALWYLSAIAVFVCLLAAEVDSAIDEIAAELGRHLECVPGLGLRRQLEEARCRPGRSSISAVSLRSSRFT